MPEFIATTPFEMEGIAAKEIKSLGFKDVSVQSGRVFFSGGFDEAHRANMWLRTPERILLHVGSFSAQTFDELFDGVSVLPWEEYLPKDAAFPVAGKCAKSKLMSAPDAQAITKKAIAQRLMKAHRVAALPESGVKYQVSVHIHSDVALLSIDTSGDSLAKRGYRTYTGEAPLRETLAASLLSYSAWYTDQPLCDPMCGTGTIAIEAAFMALDRAPGLMRNFAMESWPYVDRAMVSRAREEAESRFKRGEVCDIFASDIDPKAIALTKKHVVQAGIGNQIKIRRASYDQLSDLPDRGAFVLNPPYGTRLMTKEAAEELYRNLGKWHEAYPYWGFSAITAHLQFERHFGRRADRKRKMYNGKMECGVYVYKGQRRPRPQPEQ
ncbi:MAG: THUMP domain-containing class I SAM-dependent RNA methyltransferase [Christensenellales bacterium]|jgi:putative N6-adenine-specific DNA methylase